MRAKRLLIPGAAAVILALTTVVWLGNVQQTYSEVPSSYVVSPRGLKALYLWLEELGYRPERFRLRPRRLAEHSGVLILAAPSAEAIGDKQVETILAWVEKGNTLVYLSRAGEGRRLPPPREARLLHALGVELKDEPADPPGHGLRMDPLPAHRFPVEAFRPRPHSPATVNIKTMYFRPGWGVREVGGVSLPLVRDEETGYLYEIHRGAGRIYFFASSTPLENFWLNRGGNAFFFLSLLAAAGEEGEILFDEYHHGYSRDFGFADFARLRPVYPVLIQSLLLAAAILVSRGRRFGPAKTLPPLEQRSLREYTRSLAILYRKARHHRTALEFIHRDFIRNLPRRAVSAVKGFAPPCARDNKFQRLEREYESLQRAPVVSSRRFIAWTKELSELKKEIKP